MMRRKLRETDFLAGVWAPNVVVERADAGLLALLDFFVVSVMPPFSLWCMPIA